MPKGLRGIERTYDVVLHDYIATGVRIACPISPEAPATLSRVYLGNQFRIIIGNSPLISYYFGLKQPIVMGN